MSAVLISCSTEVIEDSVATEGSRPASVQEIVARNPEVKVGPAVLKTITEPVHCSGRIEVPPNDLISIHSLNEGFVEDIRYIQGDEVKKGERLFTMTNPAIIEKQRMLSEAHSEWKRMEKEMERQSALKEANATSLKELERITSERDILDARVKGLSAELGLIGLDVAALLEKGQYQTRFYLTAAANGYVHDIMVNRGQFVTQQVELLQMADDDHIHVELKVPAREASLIQEGQEVEFHVAQDRMSYKAEVVKVNHMLDESTGMLNVHCHIEKDQKVKVKVGMGVQATIMTSPREVMGLPIDAAIKEGESYFAFKVEGEDLLKFKLDVIKVYADFLECDGLTEGNLVISGAYYLE